MKRIESRENKWFKRLNGLKIKKNREKEGVFLAEGLRFLSEVPAWAKMDCVVLSESFAEENDTAAYEKRAETYLLPDSLFAMLCDTVRESTCRFPKRAASGRETLNSPTPIHTSI